VRVSSLLFSDYRRIPTFVAGISQTTRGACITLLEGDSLQRTEGTTMNLLDIIAPVIMLGTAYLLLFTAFMDEVRVRDKPTP
jgi:hypothetical protein